MDDLTDLCKLKDEILIGLLDPIINSALIQKLGTLKAKDLTAGMEKILTGGQRAGRNTIKKIIIAANKCIAEKIKNEAWTGQNAIASPGKQKERRKSGWKKSN